ncbi:alkaline phosphatase family protein, partial [bacterium]|nr:alkaline phosphatase family protein [bacterium]
AGRRHGATRWRRLADAGRRPVAINVPVSWPPESLEGIVVGGFLAPGLDGIAHPPALTARLEAANYRADPDNSLARTDREAYYQDLVAVEETRVALALELFLTEPWDHFHLHIMGTDRLHHFYWQEHDEGEEPWAGRFLEYYGLVDGWLARFFEAADADTTFVVMSDHGFCALCHEVDINAALEAAGLLCLGPDPDSYARNVLPGSLAFSMLPGRVYIHLRGRERGGTVSPADYGAARDKVRAALLALRSPAGERVAKEVFLREEIYTDEQGGHADGWLAGTTPRGTPYEAAPDLIVHPHNGYDLKAGFGAGKELFGRGHITGMHTWDDAMLWVSDADPGPDKSIMDIAPSILARLGVEAEGLDGSPVF